MESIILNTCSYCGHTDVSFKEHENFICCHHTDMKSEVIKYPASWVRPVLKIVEYDDSDRAVVSVVKSYRKANLFCKGYSVTTKTIHQIKKEIEKSGWGFAVL